MAVDLIGNLPCQNPNCRNHGRPHPNCHCYDHIQGGDREWAENNGYVFPGSTLGKKRTGLRGGNWREALRRGRGTTYMAHGGEIHFCDSNQPHLPTCQYYKEGGPVESTLTTKGHAAAHHGLLGLLNNVGQAKLQEPEKHNKMLQEMQGHSLNLKTPDGALHEPKRTQGVKLAEHLHNQDHDSASDLMHGHPTMGGVGKTHLPDILARLSGPMLNNPPDAEALRGSVDYLHSAIKGKGTVENYAKEIFGRGKLDIKPDKKEREELKGKVDQVEMDPESLMSVGGNLASYLPDHASQLAATAATATSYLNSIKPRPITMGPLSAPMPPDKMKMQAYDRQVDIAQKPTLVLKHVAQGTLLPDDLKTVQTIYPGLYKSMVDQVGEELINASEKGEKIPYSKRTSLSMFLGEPLDATMTPDSINAIIMAQGTQQAQNQQKKNEQAKATEVELKAIQKSDAMSETPLQSRQIDQTKD